MNYISSINLINLCIENKILKEKNGFVCVYREKGKNNKEGWYLEEKDTIAKTIMKDENVANLLISELSKKGVTFVQRKIL